MKKEELLEVIDALSGKLEITSEKIFGYYLKEAKLFRVYFWVDMIVFLGLLSLGAYLIDLNFLPIETGEASGLNFLGFIFGSILAVICFICLIIRLINITEYITSIKNPEYMAIEEIIDSLRN